MLHTCGSCNKKSFKNISDRSVKQSEEPQQFRGTIHKMKYIVISEFENIKY